MAACLCLFAASACVMGPGRLDPEAAAEAVERFTAEGGYAPAQHFKTQSVLETWRHGQTALSISLLAPEEPGPYPVVVYLPGLGEDADSAPLWRQAWAGAGYAVFAVQAVTAADALKALGKSPRTELRAVGRQQFSQTALESRLTHLGWALDELKRRAQSGLSPYSTLDTSQAVVAGYDLGAQTAAVLAGEAVKAKIPELRGWTLRGAILLSPSVDLAAGGLANRFQDIAMPLLAVTGTEDDDPYGISSPSLRSALWQHAPAGDKHLLLLRDARHTLFAGRWPGADPRTMRRQGGAKEPGGSAEDDGQTQWPDDDSEDDTQEGGGPFGTGGGPGGYAGGPRPKRRTDQRKEQIRQLAVVRSVSTAFLDATLRHRPDARLWLGRPAARWLGKLGTLRSK